VPHPSAHPLLGLALLALAVPAAAQEQPDLQAMQQSYGWRTVATVVDATTQGDISLSQAHDALAGMGLDRLRVPLKGAPGLGPLTDCGWNQAVVCKLDLPAGSTPPPVLACASGAGPVPDVSLRLVVSTEPTDSSPGQAGVEDLLPCWRQGGDRVVAAEPPPPPTPDLAGLHVTGPGADAARAALSTHAQALNACGPGTLTWSTDADGRHEILRLDSDDQDRRRAGTACVQGVLAKERLDGAAQVQADLGD